LRHERGRRLVEQFANILVRAFMSASHFADIHQLLGIIYSIDDTVVAGTNTVYVIEQFSGTTRAWVFPKSRYLRVHPAKIGCRQIV